jgi:hypothetical protein
MNSLKRSRDQEAWPQESLNSRGFTTFHRQYLRKGSREMDVKKEEKIWEPIPSRRDPLSLQVGGNWRPPISCEFKTPSTFKNFLAESIKDTIPFSPHLFQREVFGDLKETKGIGSFLKMSTKTRFTLSSNLTYTPMGKSKNQQAVEMKTIIESLEALKWPDLVNECRDFFKCLWALLKINPFPCNTWPRQW